MIAGLERFDTISAGTLVPVHLSYGDVEDSDGIEDSAFFEVVVLITIVLAVLSKTSDWARRNSNESNIPTTTQKWSIFRNVQTTKEVKRPKVSGEWICKCGKSNPNFLGQCTCGVRKAEVVGLPAGMFVPEIKTNAVPSASTNHEPVSTEIEWRCICGRSIPTRNSFAAVVWSKRKRSVALWNLRLKKSKRKPCFSMRFYSRKN